MKTRFSLKAATEDIHRALDDRLSRLNLARAEDYRQFLHVQARTVPPIEAALAAGGFGELVEGWSKARRTEALESDLSALGDQMPCPAEMPKLENIAELLGTAYVLEGSRLGGRVLKSQVGEGLPASFLSADDSLGAWPAVISAMDEHLHSEQLVGEAKDAARRCFAVFLRVAGEAGI